MRGRNSDYIAGRLHDCSMGFLIERRRLASFASRNHRHLLLAAGMAIASSLAADDIATRLADTDNHVVADIPSLSANATLTVACWITGDGMTIRISQPAAFSFWKDAEDTATRRLRFDEELTPQATRARISAWVARYSLSLEGRPNSRAWDFERSATYAFEVRGTDAEVLFPAFLHYDTLRFHASILLPTQDRPLVKDTNTDPIRSEFHLETARWQLTEFSRRCRPARRFSMDGRHAELKDLQVP